MSYSSFWGFFALSLLLLLHGGYGVYQAGVKRALQAMNTKRRVLLYGAAAVYAAVFVAGVVMMLVKMEAPAIHAMGLIVLLLAFPLNGQLRRCAKDAEDNEEE